MDGVGADEHVVIDDGDAGDDKVVDVLHVLADAFPVYPTSCIAQDDVASCSISNLACDVCVDLELAIVPLYVQLVICQQLSPLSKPVACLLSCSSHRGR